MRWDDTTQSGTARGPTPEPAGLPGVQIGPYEVEEEIARGGMGVVYRARDPEADREVAIKLLRSGSGATEVQRKRFEREALALARLRHSNVVSVHSAGDHRGSPYLVMALAQGESLGERLKREGPLPLEEAAEIIRKAAAAGVAMSMNNLGYMLENGKGVPRDEVRAVHWYRKAAEAGLAPALTNLAFMLEQGRGVAKDEVQAVAWYRQAAGAGAPRAMNNLGHMLAEGRGAAKDLAEARLWLRRALAAGMVDARDALETLDRLGPEQLPPIPPALERQGAGREQAPESRVLKE